MKKERKIPSGIEFYVVKPKISWFWTNFSPWRVCPFLYLRIVKTSRLSYKHRDSISNSQFSVLFKETKLDIYVNIEKGL